MLRKRNNLKSGRKDEMVEYTATIRFLDDSEPMHVAFQKETKGQWLLDYICKELNLVEKDYFGLRYVDADKQRIGDSKHLGIKEHWLDPAKPVYKQMKNVNPLVLCFRVKFYPPDPMVLKEEITRYFLFLQLRRDLHHGRLLCSQPDACSLAAYIIQSELGDYDPADHAPGYVNTFNMLPKQTPKMEDKISDIHKSLSGQVPSEAEGNFLKKASSLDTYGVDPYQVKDQKGNQLYLGVTHLGIVTFHGSKRSHLFRWPQVNRIAFEGKMFIIHITVQEGDVEPVPKPVKSKFRLGYPSQVARRHAKKHAYGFKCQSYSACRQLWRVAVEQQAFFTLSKSADASKMSSGGGLFQRSCKFRFSGRCQKEVIAESRNITRDPPSFVRSPSNPKYEGRSNTLPARINRDLNDSVERQITVTEVTFVRLVDLESEPATATSRDLRIDSLTESVASEADSDTASEVLIGYGTLTRKEDNIALADARDSVLMDFNIPEDDAAAVSVPPLSASSRVEPPALETVVESDYQPVDAPLALAEPDEGADEPIEYMKLDAEIECLQNELKLMKTEMPVLESSSREEINYEKSNGAACHAEPELVVEKKRKSPLRALLCSLGIGFFSFVMLAVLLILFLEVPWKEISQYQNHDRVRQFRSVYYDPMRGYVVSSWAALTK